MTSQRVLGAVAARGQQDQGCLVEVTWKKKGHGNWSGREEVAPGKGRVTTKTWQQMSGVQVGGQQRVGTVGSGAIWEPRPFNSGVRSQSHRVSGCRMTWTDLWVTFGGQHGGPEGRGRSRDAGEGEPVGLGGDVEGGVSWQ